MTSLTVHSVCMRPILVLKQNVVALGLGSSTLYEDQALCLGQLKKQFKSSQIMEYVFSNILLFQLSKPAFSPT